MFKGKFTKMVCFITLLSVSVFTPGRNFQAVWAAESKAEVISAGTQIGKVDNFEIQTKAQVERTYNFGPDYTYGDVAPINEFWGADGNYHIVYSDANTVYISIVNQDMKLQKTLEIPKDLDIVGNAVQDKQGNYYIVYGKNDKAEWGKDSAAGTAVVMSIVQYDREGKQLKRLAYTGGDTLPGFGDASFGTRRPFDFATCDLIIDSQGILVCQYGRVMYNGHQSSNALYVDTATMTKLSYGIPYTSHSFEQEVIETSDGGYLFADRGDAYERGFTVSKVMKGSNEVTAFVPFHFKNGDIYQDTYATLAGIAEVSGGYALAGTSENTLTYEVAKSSDFNESRNLFLQVFSKNFTSGSTNDSGVQLLNGETRKAQGTYESGTGKLQSGAVDYGVLWLTNYTGKIYASSPKMVDIGNDQLLLMWEKKKYVPEEEYTEDDYGNSYYDGVDFYDGDDIFDEEEMERYGLLEGGSYRNQYVETCYMVVSGNGTIIVPETTLQQEHISEFGQPAYKDGYIYWTTSNGAGKKILLHRLAVGKKVPANINVTSIKVAKDTISVAAGQKTQIKTAVYPDNASNKGLWYHYDKNIMAIDENGYITGKKVGSSKILVIAKDNPQIYAYVTVHITNKVPGNVKAVQTASQNGDYRVKISWTKISNEEVYEVYRSTSKDSGYEYVDSVYSLSYIDTGLKKNKKYYYKVKVVSNMWDDAIYNPLSDAAMVYVSEPASKVAVAKTAKTSAKVTWSRVSSASGYEVYGYDSKTKKYVLLKTCEDNTTVSFTKTNLKAGQTYSFKVRTFKTIGNVKYYSDFSKEVQIKM